MQTYTFRPYFAFDCDSEMGFNNGRYLDEITVQAPDEETARRLVMESLADEFDFDTVDADETATLDVDAAWTFDQIWRTESGEEFQSEEDIPEGTETEVSYLYQYLDIGEPLNAEENQDAK